MKNEIHSNSAHVIHVESPTRKRITTEEARHIYEVLVRACEERCLGTGDEALIMDMLCRMVTDSFYQDRLDNPVLQKLVEMLDATGLREFLKEATSRLRSMVEAGGGDFYDLNRAVPVQRGAGRRRKKRNRTP